MSEPYIGEIRIFAGNFAPTGWAFCDGRLLQIAQNTALFSLIGTIYGGDGETTTALPNLIGRAPMHWGAGPGLTTRIIGEVGGQTTVTLTEGQMPNHRHPIRAAAEDGGGNSPIESVTSTTEGNQRLYVAQSAGGTPVQMSESALVSNGSGAPHMNVQPSLGIYYIIALTGTYPSES